MRLLRRPGLERAGAALRWWPMRCGLSPAFRRKAHRMSRSSREASSARFGPLRNGSGRQQKPHRARLISAVDQISRGAQVQAAATHQANVAMEQIERATTASQDAASSAIERIEALAADLQDNRTATTRLASGVEEGLRETQAVIGLMSGLDEAGRRLEKIVDGIALV